MKIALYIRHIDDSAQQSLQQLIDILHAHGVQTLLVDGDTRLAPVDFPEFLFSIGGDGTLLSAMHLVGNSGIPVVGINFGHLGFLTTMGKDDDIEDFVEEFLAGHYAIEERTMLNVLLPNSVRMRHTALNEVSLHRSLNTSLMRTEVYVDGEFVATYEGDGVIVATPTGSTAYSLSCGGPILMPNSGCFVITPIGAHTLTLRPIIVPDTAQIRLVTDSRHSTLTLGIDSATHQMAGGLDVNVCRKDYRVRLLRMNSQNFFSAIHEKLMWGTQVRH